MLEAMRKQSRSALIYIFFGIIILVFITTFSPSSEGFASCSSSTSYLAKVSGHTVSESDFRYGFVLIGGTEMGSDPALLARVRATVLDLLLERELLAGQAERLGLRIADREIDDLIISGSIVAMGRRQDFKALFFHEGAFDYELFRRVCQYRLGQSVKDFKEQQRRELLALRMREILRAGVRISDEEVRQDFEARGRQINLEYVRFSAGVYAADIQPAAADVDGYLAKNRPKVEERYHTKKFLYQGLPKQFRARHILLAVAQDAPPEIQQQREAFAKEILERARAGSDFANLAREVSDDERSKTRGGDLGWRARNGSGYGAAFEDAAFKLAPGGISDLLRSDAGWHILRVDGLREGDQKLAAVERDIAEDLLRELRATDRARLEAEDHLRRLQAGEDWDTLFKPEETTDEGKKPVAPGQLVRRQTGMFSRRGANFPQIGVSQDLAKEAFDLSLSAPLGKKAYEVAGAGVVLVKLKDRQDPDMKDFEVRKAEIVEEQRLAKGNLVLASFVEHRCRQALRDSELRVSPAARTLGAAGQADDAGWAPCDTLGAK